MSNRPSIDDVMFETAFAWAKRSTCPSAAVGAVIARGSSVVAVGYNGAPSGAAHCSEAGCVVPYAGTREMSRHVHGEINAILHCAKEGKSCLGCDIYITKPPCLDCVKFIAQAGIGYVRIPLGSTTQAWEDTVLPFAQECGLKVIFESLTLSDHVYTFMTGLW